MRQFFTTSSPIPSLPRIVWNAMMWFNRHLHACMDMRRDAKPVLQAAATTLEDAQVPAAPPELVRRVDWLLRGSLKAGGSLVSLLMAVMAMIASWLRFRHLQRAIPTSLTKHLLWLMITRA